MSSSEVWQDYFAGKHDAVLEAGSESAEIMHITGLSLVSLGRFEEADTILIASSLVQPVAFRFSNACVAFLDANRPDLAKPHALTGLSHFPEDVDLLFNTGNVYNALGDIEQAKIHFEKAFSIDPTHWETALNLANVCRRTDELERALTLYRDHVLPNVDDMGGRIRATLNMGVTLTDLERDEEALAVFDDLAAQNIVDSPEMDFNRATLRLKLGDYKEGWSLYRRRWECDVSEVDRVKFLKPRLQSLEEGKGKRVLFCHEQGFGDAIQFIRFATLLSRAGLNIIIFTPKPLERLFAMLGYPVVTERNPDDYDFECPLMDAPALLGTTLENPAPLERIPDSPYLAVPDEMLDQIHLPDNQKMKIGVVWAGQFRDNPEMAATDKKRSMDVRAFGDLFRRSDVDIYSLQFGDRADDFKAVIPEKFWPKQPLENASDWLDTAAVIMKLDLIITVDTAVAHLAGALGKPVWLLSRFAGCWRWIKGKTDTPWYRSMFIFHQTTPGDWESVMRAVNQELD
jgi:hypothetical protein